MSTLRSVNYRMLVAGLAGGLGVSLGALGSHAFYNLMDATQHKEYNVANQYHLIHAIAMVAVAFAAPRAKADVGPHLYRAYSFFAAGVVLFSGSRYILCTVHKPAWFSVLPPIGGALLSAGWCSVLMAAF